MKLHKIAFILLIIGGLNWLWSVLYPDGIRQPYWATIARIVYILVGLSALYEVFTHKGRCKGCEMKRNVIWSE